MITYERKLVLRRCKKDFGLGVGVIASDEIRFKKRRGRQPDMMMLASVLHDVNQQLINAHVEVQCKRK